MEHQKPVVIQDFGRATSILREITHLQIYFQFTVLIFHVFFVFIYTLVSNSTVVGAEYSSTLIVILYFKIRELIFIANEAVPNKNNKEYLFELHEKFFSLDLFYSANQ